jgi:hypothetical protein
MSASGAYRCLTSTKSGSHIYPTKQFKRATMLGEGPTCSATTPDSFSDRNTPSIAASAAAARALRYPGLADVIEAEELPPLRMPACSM